MNAISDTTNTTSDRELSITRIMDVPREKL